MRFPSAVCGRVDSFSWETTPWSSSSFPKKFWSVLKVDDLFGELGRVCVGAQDTAVRSLVKFERSWRRFETITNNRPWWFFMWRWCLYSGSVFRSNNDTSEKVHLLFCFFSFRNLLAQVYFKWICIFWEPMWCSNDACPFSIFVRATSTHLRSFGWPCRARMWTGSAHWQIGLDLILSDKYCWLVVFNFSFEQSHIFFSFWTGEVSKNLTRSQSSFWSCSDCVFEQTRRVLSRMVLHRCHVFLRGLVNQAVFLVVLPGTSPLLNGKMLKVSVGQLMWLLVSFLTSHCFDLLSEWQCWLPQPDDNFELPRSSSSPNAISLGCSLFVEKYFCDWLTSASRTGSSKFVCFSITAWFVSFSAVDTLFLAGQEFPDLQDFCVIHNFTHSIKFFFCFSFTLSTSVFLVCWMGESRRFPSPVDLSLFSLYRVETEWRIPRLFEQDQLKLCFVDFQERSCCPFHKKKPRIPKTLQKLVAALTISSSF